MIVKNLLNLGISRKLNKRSADNVSTVQDFDSSLILMKISLSDQVVNFAT